MLPFETMLSRFGSRLVFNLRPQRRDVRLSPVGTFYWQSYPFHAEVTAGAKTRGLPLGDQTVYGDLSQSITATSVTLAGQEEGFPVRAELRLAAPFVPRDPAGAGTPALYVDVTLSSAAGAKGTLRVGPTVREPRPLAGEGFAGYLWEDTFAANAESFRQALAFVQVSAPGAAQAEGGGLVVGFDLAAGAHKTFHFLLAACVTDPILEVRGKKVKLDYAHRLGDIPAVIRQALGERPRVERISALFDATLLGGSLSLPACNLSAHAFHSYVANTWWARLDDGRPWYSVWEGNCGYHSTLDVEYNQAVFYLWYWPELLGMLLWQWPRFKDAAGYMPHDMGSWHRANGNQYGHAMKVEENTNYLLLLFAYWRWTGDLEIVRRHWGLVDELLEFLELCDTTGDEWPDQGTANTLDSGSYVVELSRHQTYQAVRILGVLEGAARAAEALEKTGQPALDWQSFIRYVRRRQQLVRRTLDDCAWVGDHYAVSLDRRIRGYNTYSTMTANGLVYPFLTGRWLPEMNWQRLSQGIEAATRAALRQYGCALTSVDNTGWISQNLFRDIAAAYLGIDLEFMSGNYWAYQLEVNRRLGNCFKDGWPPETVTLNYYPRGIAAFGLLPAQAGLSYDAVDGALHLCPLRAARLALPWLADWEAGKVPWVEVQLDGTTAGENLDLLGQTRVEATRMTAPGQAAADDGCMNRVYLRPAEFSPPSGDRFDFFWGRGLVTGRHGLWGAPEVAGQQAFQVVTRWEKFGRNEDDEPITGTFEVEVPSGWRCVPLDTPTFSLDKRSASSAFLCRWAILVRPGHNWSAPTVLRGRVAISTGQAAQSDLPVYADPRADLDSADMADFEAGKGLPAL